MRTITDTLDTVVGTWDDPGDYPNAVASGPLPSYDYVEDVEGELVLELSDEELALFRDDPDLFFSDDVPENYQLDCVEVRKWSHTLEGNRLTLTCEEFEVVDWMPSYA